MTNRTETTPHLVCPVCNVGYDKSLTQEQSDYHVIAHIADGKWTNADPMMILQALCRKVVVLP